LAGQVWHGNNPVLKVVDYNTLEMFTTQSANTWVQLKIKQSLAYHTQLNELASGIIHDNGINYIKHGSIVTKLPIIDEKHIYC
jgi:hypothetical protein